MTVTKPSLWLFNYMVYNVIFSSVKQKQNVALDVASDSPLPTPGLML